MPTTRTAAPILVAILMILQVLYVGSYLVMVDPYLGGRSFAVESDGVRCQDGYWNGGDWAWRLFWPLEQIDRKVRPEAWDVFKTLITK
ncbi:hypothetical protein ETAA8_59680 [Anatilimnocola aggregata]|uniref:Uncharacterized protein n=1 Tax=Anatilimnocola aggregata TaxID=2528021 RepID=A0A517YKS4_9BACT|nr:hypothetical protein [Anatilimnocola aggregata]QDU30819.1 hypothetical protein ETAA8_59680 [Anatilimnocola aggregata]